MRRTTFLIMTAWLAVGTGLVCRQAEGAINPHPRIWLTPTILSYLQARAKTDPAYSAMKAAVDVYSMSSCNLPAAPDESGMNLPISMALLYKITGNAAYGNCAITQEKKNLAYYTPAGASLTVPCTANCPFASLNDYRNHVWVAAAVFDWCYPLLSAADKAYMVSVLRASASHHMSPGVLYVGAMGGGAGNNLYSGQVSRTALIGYALYGDNPTDNSVTGSNAEIDAAMAEYNTSIQPFYTKGYGLGGAIPEGAEYGPQDDRYYAEWFDAAITATGQDLYAGLGSFAIDTLKFTLHATSPTSSAAPCASMGTTYTPLPYGDEQPGSQFLYTESHRSYMLRLANYFGTTAAGANARYWLNHIQPHFKCARDWNYLYIWNFMYSTAGLSEQDWRSSYPTDYAALADGKVISRSDWSSNATWVGFYSGPQRQDHVHPDANSFVIYRKGQWLSVNEQGWQYAYQTSFNHSTLTMNATQTSPWNGYGSAAFKSVGDASIAKYDADGGGRYAYALGRAGDQYRAPAWDSGAGEWLNVSQFDREFVYLKPDYIVIFDRVKYQNTAAFSRAQFMFPTQPSVSGNTATVVNGGQKLAVTALAPNAATISSRRMCSLGWLGMLKSESGCGLGISNCYNVCPCGTMDAGGSCSSYGSVMRYYRGEVLSGTTPSMTHQFLHTLQALDASGTPAPAEKITGPGLIAAHFKDPAGDKIVGFSADAAGAPLSLPVTYTFAPAGSVGWHLIANLPPSTPVLVSIAHTAGSTTVTINSSSSGSGQPFTTSAAGVVMFSDPFSAGNIAGSSPPPTAGGKCDLDGDGLVNTFDFQSTANQALGMSPCTTGDVNGDGKCTVLDVQIVTNDLLGNGCHTGP